MDHYVTISILRDLYIYFDVKYSHANYIHYKLIIFYNEKIIQHPVKKRENYHRLRKQDTFCHRNLNLNLNRSKPVEHSIC